MHDIFSESSDVGAEFSQSVASVPAQPETDQNDSTALADPSQPTGGDATGTDRGQEGQDGTQAQTAADQAPPQEGQQTSEEELARLEQQAEAALNDERTPKWFKNLVSSVYKPKLEKLGTEVQQYSSYGTPEELQQKLELVEGLGETRLNPETYRPEYTTERFVQKTYERNPQLAMQLMVDLGNLPSPETQSRTILQELFAMNGIDPARIEDVKRFAAAGYTMQQSAFPAPDPEDLAEIPEQFHATFAQLSPDVRYSLMSDNPTVRDANLAAHQYRLERESAEAAQKAQQEEADRNRDQQQAQEFRNKVEEKGQEYFTKESESVLQSFVASVTKQAGMSQMDSLMIANTVLNAFEPTLAGQMSRQALEAEGVQLDPEIPQIIQRLEQTAKQAAAFELSGDQAGYQDAVQKVVDLKDKLAGKGNKIVASLAQKRANRLADPHRAAGQQLGNPLHERHAVTGAGGTVNGNSPVRDDFSEDSYLGELRASGFGR